MFMPDLNLIDDEGMEGASTGPTPRSGGGGGGGTAKVLVIIVALVVLGGGVFLLNKFGIIKLWGKKAPPAVTQVQEDAFPADLPPEQLGMAEDTSMAELLETPPISEPVPKKDEPMKPFGMDAMGKSKLNEMTGNYTIQVSAWRDKATADLMVKRLDEAGYPAYVERRDYKDGTWFTVRIGRYPSPREAKKAVETFALELRSSYWIDRVRSK
jgi:hypothetical protein